VLAGGAGFAYSEYFPWATGTVTEDYSLTDSRLALPLRDVRQALNELVLPPSAYTAAEFPLADENIIGRRRPFGFGSITGAVPNCVDVTNRVFEFHAGRIKSVSALRQNGTALVQGTDYFVDFQRGRVTLARGLSYQSQDKIEVDFVGQPDGLNAAIDDGALIFLYALRNWAGLGLADIDLDSIYETAEGSSVALAAYLFKDSDFASFTRRLERSVLAYAHQDGQGRIGFKTPPAAAPSSIIYVPEQYVFEFSMAGGKNSRYKIVEIGYAEDPATETFSWTSVALTSMDWKYGVKGTLKLETFLSALADAEALRASVVALLDRAEVRFSAKRLLYPVAVADLVYLTRARYYSQAGTANNVLLKVISVGKSASGDVTIRAEEA
jgi:hypothetical protein